MRTRVAAFIAFLFGAVSLVSVAAVSPAHAKDMNCDDFDNQAQAQHYFDSHGGGPNNDVDGLDSDGDGVACESNPCPCAGPGGGGGGGGGGAEPKKHRFISIHFKATNNGHKYKLYGVVKPIAASKHKPVTLLRAQCKTCKYKPFKSSRTTKKATYKFAHLKKVGWFKVKVPASNGFADSFSARMHVFNK